MIGAGVITQRCGCAACDHFRNSEEAKKLDQAGKLGNAIEFDAKWRAEKDVPVIRVGGPVPPPMTSLERTRIRAEVIHLVAQAFEVHMDRIDLVDMITEEWWSAFGRTGADALAPDRGGL